MNLERVIEKLFPRGMTDEDAVKAFAELDRRGIVYERTVNRIRRLEYLAADIERHDLKTLDGIRELERHVKNNWNCREVCFLQSFLHGGQFVPDTRRWVRNSSGISTSTHQEDSNLSQLWSRLMYDIHTFMGAAAVMELKGSRILPGLVLTDEGDDASLWDLSIDEMVRLVLREKSKRLDLVSVVAEAARKGARDGLKDLPVAVRKAYRQAANSDDPDPLAPKSRRSGAGRKKIFDIGNVQVRAVLALMEECREQHKPKTSGLAYSDSILRKPPRGVENPYTSSRSLDSAVRQYCMKLGIAYDPPVDK